MQYDANSRLAGVEQALNTFNILGDWFFLQVRLTIKFVYVWERGSSGG